MLVQISGSVPSASAVSPPPSQRKPKITASRKLLLKVSGVLALGETAWEADGCRAPLRLG